MALGNPPVMDGLMVYCDADYHFTAQGAAAAVPYNLAPVSADRVELTGPSLYTSVDPVAAGQEANNGHRMFQWASGFGAPGGPYVPGMKIHTVGYKAADTVNFPDRTDIAVMANGPYEWNSGAPLMVGSGYGDPNTEWPMTQGLVRASNIPDPSLTSWVLAYTGTAWESGSLALYLRSLNSPWTTFAATRNDMGMNNLEDPWIKVSANGDPWSPVLWSPTQGSFYPDTHEYFAGVDQCYAYLRYNRELSEAELFDIHQWVASWSAPQVGGQIIQATEISATTYMFEWDTSWGTADITTSLGETFLAQTSPFISMGINRTVEVTYSFAFANATSGEEVVPAKEVLLAKVTASNITDKTMDITQEDTANIFVYRDGTLVAPNMPQPYLAYGLTKDTVYDFLVEDATHAGSVSVSTVGPSATYFYSQGGTWVQAAGAFVASGGTWKPA
jgi:hypothetical protein